MSYSNLYKSGWVVVKNEDVRVIDNNILFEEKFSSAPQSEFIPEDESGETEEGFVGGLAAEQVDTLLDSDGSGSVVKGALAAEKDAILQEIEQAKEELAALRAQADRMIDEAKSQIGAMQIKAYEEAKNQGYLEGERLGKKEAEGIKQEYLTKKQQLESDYEKKLEELEPEFIDTLTGIYEHIFKVDLSRHHDLVANLLINALQKVEGSHNFLIHVSREDFEGAMANRERMRAEAGSGKVALELVEDMTLSRSQCYIETENGIYDCSLDTQLSELGRKLKLLSYTRD